MKKNIRLSIPEPCHENWSTMKPVEKGRFCGSCQKEVVDFTSMSDSQLIAFFKKPSTGSVCGRLFSDQVDRDLQLPRKRIPWIKYFFQFMIPAFFASSKAVAQGGVVHRIPATVVVADSTAPKPIADTKPSAQSRVIEGVVTDVNGKGLAGASVIIKDAPIAVRARVDGSFRLVYDHLQEKIILIASYVGYDSQEILVDINKPVQLLTFQLKPRETQGLVVVVGYMRREPEPKKKAKNKEKYEVTTDSVAVHKSTLKSTRDSVFKKIRIFPNPVMPGASLNIEWKKMKDGYYMLELFAQSGTSVYQREIWVDENARLVNIEIPAVAAGTYLLRVKSKESGMGFSETVIVG
jgi:hypothetical protein